MNAAAPDGAGRMIALDSVSKWYPTHRGRRRLLCDVTARLPAEQPARRYFRRNGRKLGSAVLCGINARPLRAVQFRRMDALNGDGGEARLAARQ